MQFVLVFYFLVWAREVSPGQYGSDLLLLFYGTLAANIFDFTIPQFIYKWGVSADLAKLNLAVIVSLFLGTVFLMILLNDRYDSTGVIEIALFSSSSMLGTYFSTILNIQNKRKLVNILELMGACFFGLGIVILSTCYLDLFLELYILFYCLKAIFVGIVVLRSQSTILSSFSVKDVINYFKETRNVIFDKVINFSASNVEKIYSKNLFSPSSLGYHFAGQQLGLKSFSMLSQYVSRAYPVVYSDGANLRIIFERMIIIISNFSLLFFVIFGPSLFVWIYGSDYRDGLPFFEIQVFFSYLYSINSYQGIKFYNMNKSIFSVSTTMALFLTNGVIFYFTEVGTSVLFALRLILVITILISIIVQVISYKLDSSIPYKVKDFLLIPMFLFCYFKDFWLLESLVFFFTFLMYFNEIRKSWVMLNKKNLV